MPSATTLLAPVAGILVVALFAPQQSDKFVGDRCAGRRQPECDEETLKLVRNHSLVHIGGQHRGGTTLLWRVLRAHPAVASHGHAAGESANDPRALHGEGLFLQNVYPRLSLDHPPAFFMWKRLHRWYCAALALTPASVAGAAPCRLREGIGSYALSGASNLGADHPLASHASSLRLFAQWTVHWEQEQGEDYSGRLDGKAGGGGMRRPLLLEKSPSNALTCGMLAAGWAALGSRGTTRFIFVTRHPVMQAKAMHAFVDDLTISQLVENWLAIEEAVRARAAHLPRSAVALLSLEALAARPRPTVEGLLRWMGVPGWSAGDAAAAVEERSRAPFAPSSAEVLDADAFGASEPAAPAAAFWEEAEAAAWLQAVREDPNARYAAEYEAQLRADAEARAAHEAMVVAYEARVGAVSGYDLGRPERYRQPPERTSEWLRGWLARAGK